MAVPSDYTDEEIAEAIDDCKGYMRAIADKLLCKVASIRDRIMNTPELRAVLDDNVELVSDDAERYLIEAIQDRRPWAIKYWLGRKARNRGYGQKLEVEGKLDSGGNVHVYLPDDGRESKPDGNGDSTAEGSAGNSTPQ